MITDEEWKKLKVGDVIWHTPTNGVKAVKIKIDSLDENGLVCNGIWFPVDGVNLYLTIDDAIDAVDTKLKIKIEKIQQQINENLKELKQS
jgi:hypothetical protein